ncbi:unnamed protein product [Allacma fusca]|uniref:Uncharacterized protein n=1 Tax=Allacma fusca TaxID=39272 RepID=A0A8J2KRG8_9HEXA|nr:unnamed protein product [Allacma fusca]
MAAYLGKLSDAEKQALEADTAKRIAEEVAKVAAGFKVTVTNHAIPTPVYDKNNLHKTQKLEEQGKTKLPPIIATKDKANNSNEQAKSEVTGSSSQSQNSARGQFQNSYRGR